MRFQRRPPQKKTKPERAIRVLPIKVPTSRGITGRFAVAQPLNRSCSSAYSITVIIVYGFFFRVHKRTQALNYLCLTMYVFEYTLNPMYCFVSMHV